MSWNTILFRQSLLILSLVILSKSEGEQKIKNDKSWQMRVEHSNDENLYKQICEPAKKLGVELETLGNSVSHATHDITVEDIRYFFDENFPVDNDIPTSDTNLTVRQPVLPYVPSKPSVFKFPGLAALDWIMTNDDKDDFLMRNPDHEFSHMEKLTHQVHMLELWHKMSKVYRGLQGQDIDLSRVCPCLTDELSNGMIDYMKRASLAIRGVRFRDSNDNGSYPVPALTDSTTYKLWKQFVATQMLNDKMIFNAAVYMYCKISALKCSNFECIKYM